MGTSAEAEAAAKELKTIAEELETHAPTLTRKLPELPGKLIRQKMVFYWTILFVAFAVIIACIGTGAVSLSPLLVAVLAAPFGAWLRYFLGMRNANHRIPLYTFLVNMAAASTSAFLAYALEQSCGSHAISDTPWREVLKGLSAGFCGSLSTVSSFVDEVRRLGEVDRKLPVLYVTMTLLGGQGLALTILAISFATTDGCDAWIGW